MVNILLATRENVRFAAGALKAHKLRSALTVERTASRTFDDLRGCPPHPLSPNATGATGALLLRRGGRRGGASCP